MLILARGSDVADIVAPPGEDLSSPRRRLHAQIIASAFIAAAPWVSEEDRIYVLDDVGAYLEESPLVLNGGPLKGADQIV